MGPKDKGKGKKGKKPTGGIDQSEVVTELMREMFEIQMTDIETKIKKHTERQKELREWTERIEHSIVEHQKLKGLVIDELKSKLEVMEEEKVNKRNHLDWLASEVKLNRQRLETAVANKRKEIDDMMDEMNKRLDEMNETINMLLEYKKNKDALMRDLERREKEMEETERQHRRNLFAIMQKLYQAKSKLKKDLESRLLHLSIDFQSTSRIKIGAPVHRMMQENRAIENELAKIGASVKDFEAAYEAYKGGMEQLKVQEKSTVEGKDKLLAKCLIQKNIMKELRKVHNELVEKIEGYMPILTENDTLMKKFKALENQIDRRKAQASELREMLDVKKGEASKMNEVSVYMRKNTRRLGILLRNALKAAEEAMAVKLIPFGETEEEKFMSEETKLKMYHRRRDFAFKKKGKCLMNLKEIILRAQFTREEWKTLEAPEENRVDFYALFSQAHGPQPESSEEADTLLRRRSSASLSPSGSADSLPRSLTPEEEEMVRDPGDEMSAFAKRPTLVLELGNTSKLLEARSTLGSERPTEDDSYSGWGAEFAGEFDIEDTEENT